METKPGKYYERIGGRTLREYDGDPPPEVVICRRLADFPQGTPPPGAVLWFCAECHATLVGDPKAPHQELPRICLQCAGIRPLPWTP